MNTPQPALKKIVITGTARGLGRALGEWLCSRGHTVAGCSRNAESMRELDQKFGPDSCFTQADISDESAVATWARHVLDVMGPPDLLINNAGVIHDDAAFLDIPSSEFERLIRVNVLGTSHVIRAFLPAMQRRQKGTIVNLSSGAGVIGFPNMSAYCTSKFALEGLSKSIASELPEGMSIIPLQPGVIHTDMLDQHYGERAQDFDPPDIWAERAGPYILGLGPEHNGQSLRIPDSD